MKQTFILTLFIYAFSIGCSKRDNEFIAPTESRINMANVNQAAVQQVASFTATKLKTAYRLLNDDEKAFFWQYRLSVMKETPGLSNEQTAYLNKLSGYLVPSLFKLGTKENTAFKAQQVQELVLNGNKLFTKNALKFIMAGRTFSKIPLTGRLATSAVQDDEAAACNCNLGSKLGDDCTQVWWPQVCGTGSGCRESTLGCGAFYLFNCNGLCRDII